MRKRISQGFTRMYVTLIALLVLVSLTGFVDRGRAVTIEADGRTHTVYTHAINAEALLRENNISLGHHDEVELSTDTLKEGTTATVRRAVPVTIEYKNQKKTIRTAKKTVQEAVEQAGYDVENYRAYGDVSAPVKENMTIKVGVLSRKEITEDEVVPYAIESIPDETLGQGEEQVLQQGVNGHKTVRNYLVSLDGQVIGKEHLSTTLVAEMQPLIRHVGTKETVEINTGTISKYKAVYTMVATAYLPTDGNGEGITKMGTRARYGEIAVDPNVIPLGTTVYIPGYGVARAEDTGSDILGNRVDLCMLDYNQCMQFGRRTVLVYILE